MRKSKILATTILLGIVMLIVFTAPGAAHEHREVGDFELTAGWRVEPAIVGQLNGPEVFVARAASEHEEGENEGEDHEHEAASLEELEVSLDVEVIFGPASRTITMQQAFGEPGHFVADLIPTRPGDYIFRITGTIDDVEIDESFDSAEGLFGSVEPASDIQFPEPDPTVAELMAQIAALETRIADLEAQLSE